MDEHKLTSDSIAKTYRTIAGSNDVIAPASVLLGPVALADWGMAPVIPEFYYNFCAVVEAVVLSDQIITLSNIRYSEPFVDTLRQAGVIVEIADVVRAKANQDPNDREVALNLMACIFQAGEIISSYFSKVDPLVKILGFEEEFKPYREKARIASPTTNMLLDIFNEFLLPDINSVEDLIDYAMNDFAFGLTREISFQNFIEPIITSRVLHLSHAFDSAAIIDKAVKDFYTLLKKEYQEKVKEIQTKYPLIAINNAELPPLTTVLLERCKGDRKQLANELLGLRDDLSTARAFQREYNERLSQAKSMKELIEIDQDIEFVWKALNSKLHKGKTRWIYRTWDYVKLLNPKDMFVKLMDDAISNEQEINNYKVFNAYYSLWRESLEADFNIDLVTKTFGMPPADKKMDLFFSSFTLAKKFIRDSKA